MNRAHGGFIPALGFRWLTPVYDPLVAATTRERVFKRALIAQAGARNGDRVLDLGCGTGTLAIRLKQAVPGALVTGVDADEAVLARARRKATRAGVELRWDRARAERLPYAAAARACPLSNCFENAMKAFMVMSAAWFLVPGLVLATDPAHALRQTRGDVVFHYRLVPAQVVLAHPDKHPERELHGGASATRRLQPMKIADQPSFGGFFALGVPGIYRLRFEARVPGHVQPASAEFEYRVSPEGRR